MNLWKHPSNYAGATWEGWYVFLGQNRDSDCLERSNFKEALEAVKGKMDRGIDVDGSPSVLVVREGHWAVGWVEWIAIHPSDAGAVAEAESIEAALADYPVVNEDAFSEMEHEEALEYLGQPQHA